MSSTPTQPTGHEEAVEVIHGLIPVPSAEGEDQVSIAREIVAALADANRLATEEEFVYEGEPGMWFTSLEDAREAAVPVQAASGIDYPIRSRRVTAWTEVAKS